MFRNRDRSNRQTVREIRARAHTGDSRYMNDENRCQVCESPGTWEDIKDEAVRIEFERWAIWPWEENSMECNIYAVVPAAAFFFGRNGGKWHQEREKEG